MQVYCTSARELKVWYAALPPCPSLDSALCAIARAVDLCDASRPPPLAYHPPSLRPHLSRCLALGALTPFPPAEEGASSREQGEGGRLYAGVPVYCYCRRPGDECMVMCVVCLESFHCECVEYSGGDFMCRNCCSGGGDDV